MFSKTFVIFHCLDMFSSRIANESIPQNNFIRTTRFSICPKIENKLGMDHLILDWGGGGGGGGWANPKKNVKQAHPPGKKNLARRWIFG